MGYNMLVAFCVIFVTICLFILKKSSKYPLVVKNYVRDKVYLFIFACPASAGIISHSPFCGKLYLYLKMRGIPFEERTDKFPGPRGQLPFIEINGECICDSDNIIHRLDQHFPVSSAKAESIVPVPFDDNQYNMAIATSIQCIVENSLYFKMVYFRWATEEGWTRVKNEFFRSLPIPLRWIVPVMARRSVMDRLYKQGTSRLSEEEIQRSIERDLDALSSFLGDRTFFMNTKKPTLVDITVYATLHNFPHLYPNCPLGVSLEKRLNLVKFCRRFKSLLA